HYAADEARPGGAPGVRVHPSRDGDADRQLSRGDGGADSPDAGPDAHRGGLRGAHRGDGPARPGGAVRVRAGQPERPLLGRPGGTGGAAVRAGRRPGEEGKKGVLKSMRTRQEFLADLSHRVRFVYTPKHSSWMNQVEIVFGIVMRKVIRRGSFTSTEDLRNQILAFIDYFNQVFARPFKWTYTGRPLHT